MPERDGYIPGLPCWVDTSQPDPHAAVDFYSGLFGWEFESVLPPDSPGEYSVARLRGGDVAAVGSIPEALPPMAMWNTYVWVEGADDTAAKVRDAGGSVVMEPFDVMDSGRMAVFTDREGAAFCVWQAKEHKGARIVNEPVSPTFNGLNTPRRGRREVVLRLGVRLDDAGARRRRDVDASGLRRLPRARQSRPPQADRGGGRTDGVRGRRRQHQPDFGRPARHTAALERDLLSRGHRRHRGKGHRAGRKGDRPSLRRSLVPADDHQRPAGRDSHRQRVRAREQGPREPGGRCGQRYLELTAKATAPTTAKAAPGASPKRAPLTSGSRSRM